MHGETEAKGLAGFCEALHLSHAAPVVVVAKYDLHRVEAYGFGKISKGGDGHVAGQRGIHAFSQKAFADLGHAREACCWIFEVSAS